MKITIKKPCHENWDTMLPDEKGAFCLSCQKSVVDFSNKTLGQIKDFFTKTTDTQSVCGRFDESQLTALSFDDFFADFMNWKFIRKVSLIVFFVFGLSLFGTAQTKPHHVKEPPEKMTGAPEVTMGEPMIMGDIEYVPQDTTKKICVKDTLLKEPMIMGKIQYRPQKPEPETRPKKMGKVKASPSKK